MTTAVAVALYNGERFIEKQLDCLRSQTKVPEQVVLCDDGSSDNTVEIVENYIRLHGLERTWKLYKNPENLGYIRNFYRAISLCETEIVFLCDQDDIWEEDKILKMSQIMEQREEIMLLSCKYGIIDADENQLSSIIERPAREDGTVYAVSVEDIMRAYRWPGMVMCIRKNFYDEISKNIVGYPIPHDLAFTICAADKNGFYEYSYVGAHHRRHDNNTAREEHRVSKVLNLKRKLSEVVETRKMLQSVVEANLPVTVQTQELVDYKLERQCKREEALRNKDLRCTIQLYRDDPKHILRKMSLICDLWLVLFGKTE